jgi:hypothetical protein
MRPDLHRPAQSNCLEERLAIGFLTGNIHVGASHQIWPRCSTLPSAVIFCFRGGGLGAAAEFES